MCWHIDIYIGIDIGIRLCVCVCVRARARVCVWMESEKLKGNVNRADRWVHIAPNKRKKSLIYTSIKQSTHNTHIQTQTLSNTHTHTHNTRTHTHTHTHTHTNTQRRTHTSFTFGFNSRIYFQDGLTWGIGMVLSFFSFFLWQFYKLPVNS